MPLISDLTKRQIDILDLIGKGLSNKEVAGLLEISVNTVKAHTAAVLRVLEVSNRTEAAFTYQQLIQERDIEMPIREPDQLTKNASQAKHQSSAYENKTIAVVPFINLSEAASHDHLGEGFAEELSVRLAGLRWLPVIAFNSCRNYSSADDLFDVANKLNCDYVLSGSVRWLADQICITTELVSVQTDHLHPVWRARYQKSANDLFSTLNRIAIEMAASLDHEVIDDQMLPQIDQQSDCWNQAMAGLWYLNRRSHQNTENALIRFDASINLNEQWALPFYGRAMTRYQQWFEQWCEERNKHLELIEQDAKQCILLDPQLANGHLVFALVQIAQGQMMVASQSLQQALILNPSLAHAYSLLGQIAGMAGQDQQAVGYLEKALKLNPRDPARWSYFTALAMTHFAATRYSEAIMHAGEAIAFGRESALPHIALIASYVALDELDKAQQARNLLNQRHPTFKVSYLKQNLKGARPELIKNLFACLTKVDIIH